MIASRLAGVLAVVTLTAWLPIAWQCKAATGAPLVPFEAIRSLQQLQDQIAEGDSIAQAAHAKAIEQTARVFAEAKLSIWSDVRNARALVIYLFSGGRGAIIEAVVPPSAVASDYRGLYVGALAYAAGDDDQARAALMSIDPRKVPVAVGSHLALVQASLIADSNRTKAIALLDLARLLAPGTLIEEAALRKEMSLIGATGDLDKFCLLARRYLGRFRHSIYADNFRQLVATSAMQIGAADSDEAGLRLARIAASLDKTDRRRLYLAIARAAVLAGHLKMAALAGEEARRLSDPAGPDEARALVYLGAATIVGDRFDIGQKALQNAVPARLNAKDRALRDSAVAVADMIRRPTAKIDGQPTDSPKGDVISDAEHALAGADTMLTRAAK